MIDDRRRFIFYLKQEHYTGLSILSYSQRQKKVKVRNLIAAAKRERERYSTYGALKLKTDLV